MATAPGIGPDTQADDAILDSLGFRVGRWLLGGMAGVYALATLLPKDDKPTWWDTWFYGVAILAVTLAGLARPLLVKRDRLPWLLLALAAISWAAGDQYWTIMFADADEIPLPSPADVGYLALYPLASVGLILLARSQLKRVSLSVVLDALVASLAVGALVSAFTVSRVITGISGSPAEVITNLSYPLGDLVLIVVVVATLSMVGWPADPVWWLLVAGFGLFAVADTAYLLGANSWYDDGSWVDGAWMAGIALIPLAGTLRRRTAPAVLGGLTAVAVQVMFSLVGLSVLVVSAFVHLHPLTIALAAACLVAAVTALTYEQTQALRRSRTEALTDDLTTVGNRRVLDDRMPALIAASSQGQPLLLSIVSIRHLPEINETLGYEYGDGLLAALGTRLRERLDGRTVSARLGGAEIAVLQPFDGHLHRAEQSMRDLLTAIGEPVRRPVARSTSSCPPASRPVRCTRPTAGGLLRCAADALRRAKATESEVEMYDPAQDVGRDFGPRLLPELIGALDNGLIVASYEPIVDLTSGTAIDLEAKLRWVHPEHGVLDAATLRPLAARAGLTRRLTRVLDGRCRAPVRLVAVRRAAARRHP